MQPVRSHFCALRHFTISSLFYFLSCDFTTRLTPVPVLDFKYRSSSILTRPAVPRRGQDLTAFLMSSFSLMNSINPTVLSGQGMILFGKPQTYGTGAPVIRNGMTPARLQPITDTLASSWTRSLRTTCLTGVVCSRVGISSALLAGISKYRSVYQGRIRRLRVM
jgi:hypothetical protein